MQDGAVARISKRIITAAVKIRLPAPIRDAREKFIVKFARAHAIARISADLSTALRGKVGRLYVIGPESRFGWGGESSAENLCEQLQAYSDFAPCHNFHVSPEIFLALRAIARMLCLVL